MYSNGTGSTVDDQMVINSTAYCYVYGNVMSLLYSTGFEDKTSLSGFNYAFSSLFEYNAKIKNHKSLSLELPATTLAEGCYFAMFLGCTSLTTAPTLPATILTTSCYYYMFHGCSVLNSITCLATSGINENYSTSFWLYDVAASGTFIKDSNVDEATWRATGIPDGWNFQDYVPPTI